MPDWDRRLGRLRTQLRRSSCENLLVTDTVNVKYLTGFTGEDSWLLVTREPPVLITDPRFTTQLEEECPGLKLCVRRPGTKIVKALAKLASNLHVSRLAIESDSLSLSHFDVLSGQLPKTQLVRTQGLVERLRITKDAEEVEQIRQAVHVAQRALAVVLAGLRPEQTELEVAHKLEQSIRSFGGVGCSFPPIVAVGPRAALPHARAGSTHIGAQDLLLIDWGASHGPWQYVSDLTRVFWTGRISPKLERIHELVLRAQRSAIDAIRPGVALAEVDLAARSVIASAGFGKHFGHGLGHGIGLQIHEQPRLSQGQNESLKAGMVVTVEPGIYLPGWGGVRIEDDVLVTRRGREVLSSVSKDLFECGVTM